MPCGPPRRQTADCPKATASRRGLCVLQRQPCGSQPVLGRAGPAGAGVGVRRQDRLSLPGAGPPPVVQDVLPGGGRCGAAALRGQRLEGRAGAEGRSGAAFRHPRPSAATVGPTGLGPAEPDPDAPGADSPGGRSGRVVQRQHGCLLGTGATYRCRLETDRLRGQDHPGAPGAAHARLEPDLLQPGRGGTARAWPEPVAAAASLFTPVGLQQLPPAVVLVGLYAQADTLPAQSPLRENWLYENTLRPHDLLAGLDQARRLRPPGAAPLPFCGYCSAAVCGIVRASSRPIPGAPSPTSPSPSWARRFYPPTMPPVMPRRSPSEAVPNSWAG